ncbi:Sex-regulated protein janus-B [Seminavis robusta]|uniref:Sex-regulated protein janus-B n=1 Tax=Seminavis robusta TaxID=568900 RepID=A0A9N8D4B5_9STRA|nr:Sex-regulated protein janus-B [Seminavis robusta]|eukprot:Sro2_g001630.1 Sex-regulated protein janus-B (629) ;mRNA; r:208178-210064
MPSAFAASSWDSSDWAIHVAIAPEDAPIKAVDAIDTALGKYREKTEEAVAETMTYSAEDLIELGAAWYLPAQDMDNIYKKPSRLSKEEADFLLQEGDYIRIHHNPRRFPAVTQYDWSLDSQSQPNSVVVDYNPSKGFLVLNKPPECIPVHATVDNHAENMAACLKRANPDLDYVVTPHRLDQNTSGLITLATSKTFAAYYAQLLRHKTASKLPTVNIDSTSNEESDEQHVSTKDGGTSSGIHKVYRCLVCLVPPSTTDEESSGPSWSVDTALQKLQTYAKDQTIIRHYLEPSVRAPKRFYASLPANATTTITSGKTEAGWAECLMRIHKVGDVCALRGNAASDDLAKSLWSSAKEVMPPTCQAVVELEVELLTGRTHQIRGQLSAEGYPLVGDVPYGGAEPRESSYESKYGTTLALQCCRLNFLDPDIRTFQTKKKGNINKVDKMIPSKGWNEYELNSAWWTPILALYKEAMKRLSLEEMTTMAALDIGLVDSAPRMKQRTSSSVQPESLPPQAILSAGRQKYVLVKSIDPNTYSVHEWFVKSASPQECGGPYHKDVARDLVEWIEACGYKAVVTGGGRILYQPDTKRALVYGFSYGFGRGDHARAAKVIKEWDKDMDAAYDDSPDLY